MAEPRYLYRCFPHPTYSPLHKSPSKVMPLWDVHVERFVVIKETPRGVWITHDCESTWKKFVLLTRWDNTPTLKRWANTTIQDAVTAFCFRMHKALDYTQDNLVKYSQALRAAEAIGPNVERNWELNLNRREDL